jgi:hypothetical protein
VYALDGVGANLARRLVRCAAALFRNIGSSRATFVLVMLRMEGSDSASCVEVSAELRSLGGETAKLILLPLDEIAQQRDCKGILPMSVLVNQPDIREGYEHLVNMTAAEWLSQ